MQIFHRSTNTIAKVSIFGAVFFLAFLAWTFDALMRSPYATRQGVVLKQPVPFSHKHHVAGLGIDCRYCHTSVEQSAVAGLPPTETCMNCHNAVWPQSPKLAPVRDSYATGMPVQWVRVHDLPDFVYFNHSAHVTRGVGCVECHGRVDRMEQVYWEQPLSMAWCLGCHRAPETHLRPVDQVTNMEWTPPEDAAVYGAKLRAANGINPPTDCSTCHR